MAKAPPDKYAELFFPLQGIDVSQPHEEQPPQTTVSGINVRSFEPGTNRLRGGARPGMVEYVPHRVSGPNLIQELNAVVWTSTSAFGTGGGYYPPTTGPVIITSPPYVWPGETITIKGTNFPPAHIVIDAQTPIVPTGSNPVTVVVPITTPDGPTTIIATNPPAPNSPPVAVTVVSVYAAISFETGAVAQLLDYFGNVLYQAPELAGYEAPVVTMDQSGNSYWAAALPPGGINYVQSVGNNQNSGTTINVTYGSNVVKNNLLVIGVIASSSSVTLTASDSRGNSWSKAGEQTGSAKKLAIFYAQANSSGACVATITSSSSVAMEIVAAEYTGQNLGLPFGSFIGNASGSPGTNPQTGIIATSEVGDLQVAFEGQGFGAGGAPTVTVAADFTKRILQNGANQSMCYADYTPSNQSENASFTLSTSLNWVAAGASFKIPPAGMSIWGGDPTGAATFTNLLVIADCKHVCCMTSQFHQGDVKGIVWVLFQSTDTKFYVANFDAQTGNLGSAHLKGSDTLPTTIPTGQCIAQSGSFWAVTGTYSGTGNGVISIYTVATNAFIGRFNWPPASIPSTGISPLGPLTGDGQGNFYIAATVINGATANDGVAFCDSNGNLSWTYFQSRGVASPTGMPTGLTYDTSLSRVVAAGPTGNCCLNPHTIIAIDPVGQTVTATADPGTSNTSYSISAAGDGTFVFSNGADASQLNFTFAIQWTVATGLSGLYESIAAFNWNL